MLLTSLTVQLGSTGTLPPGCGGVQYAVHICCGGVARIFHARKKHLPLSEMLLVSWDVMAMPLSWSTRTFVAPAPWYTAPGLFPATELTPVQIVKLSMIFPVRAFRA